LGFDADGAAAGAFAGAEAAGGVAAGGAGASVEPGVGGVAELGVGAGTGAGSDAEGATGAGDSGAAGATSAGATVGGVTVDGGTAAGAVPGGLSKIDRGAVGAWAIIVSARQTIMKSAARMAVTRVRKLALPRTLMNEAEAEEPMPSPPPSERWSNTTPISPTAKKTCKTRRTVSIDIRSE
jgi:hypothetical protein